jgi:hypothetical protein
MAVRMRIVGTAILLTALLCAPPESARAADELYEAQAIVTGQREPERLGALPDCLEDVLIKVSGDAHLIGDRRLVGADTIGGADLAGVDRVVGTDGSGGSTEGGSLSDMSGAKNAANVATDVGVPWKHWGPLGSFRAAHVVLISEPLCAL